jgi:hypothetical protein
MALAVFTHISVTYFYIYIDMMYRYSVNGNEKIELNAVFAAALK